MDLLADMHDVVPDRRGTLLSRLQHLSRAKFPSGVNTGRGNKASYGAMQIAELLLAFELMQLGVPSERAIKMVAHSDGLEWALSQGLGYVDDGSASKTSICAIIHPSSLAESFGSYNKEKIGFSIRSSMMKLLAKAGPSSTSISIIDVTELMIAGAATLEKLGFAAMSEVDLELRRASQVALRDRIGKIEAMLAGRGDGDSSLAEVIDGDD